VGWEWLPAHAYSFGLIFARMTPIALNVPAMSETFVSVRLRVTVAFWMSVVLWSVVAPDFPPMPSSLATSLGWVMAEVVKGFFLGSLMRLWLSVLHVVASVASNQAGLSMASIFDPSQADQSTTIGLFMSYLATAWLLATVTHHRFIVAVTHSFQWLPVGQDWQVQSMAEAVVQTASAVMVLSLQMAAPQLIVGILLFGGAGVLSRLMPSFQIFFLMTPIQILISVGLLALSSSAWLGIYVEAWTQWLEFWSP
jgi:flagellar biosynthetic protein FliR